MGIVKVKHVVTAILDLIRFPPSFPGLKGLIKLHLNLGGLMGNILEKTCLNCFCFATFSVGWGGVVVGEVGNKANTAPVRVKLKFELGNSL